MSKYKIVIYFFFFMVLFLSKTMSENSKNLFDFSIDSINGDKLNLSKFKGKTILGAQEIEDIIAYLITIKS